jgi:hypothetical protein
VWKNVGRTGRRSRVRLEHDVEPFVRWTVEPISVRSYEAQLCADAEYALCEPHVALSRRLWQAQC